MIDASMNTGTKAVGFTLMGSELVAMISDAKWLLVVIMACVLADFRYGWGESNKRYEQARSEGDKVGMHAFKWRTSRAVRRTVNKSVDYLIWVCLGMLIGWAILKPLGVDYMLGAIIATIIAVCCEAKSIIGHFIYLHGIKIEEKTVKGFFKAFAVAIAKKKDAGIGEALEDALEMTDKGGDNGNKSEKNS
mgnify:CR=1 FL=1|jgi:hypothetical protein